MIDENGFRTQISSGGTPTNQQKRAAARVVAKQAKDTEELKMFLDMLGITPGNEKI